MCSCVYQALDGGASKLPTHERDVRCTRNRLPARDSKACLDFYGLIIEKDSRFVSSWHIIMIIQLVQLQRVQESDSIT